MDVKPRELVVVSPTSEIIRLEDVLPDINVVREEPVPY